MDCRPDTALAPRPSMRSPTVHRSAPTRRAKSRARRAGEASEAGDASASPFNEGCRSRESPRPGLFTRCVATASIRPALLDDGRRLRGVDVARLQELLVEHLRLPAFV